MADRTCSVEGCDRSAKARGFCNPHYQRWYRYGDADFMPQPVAAASTRCCRTCGANLAPGRRCEACKWKARKRVPCAMCGKPTGWPASQADRAGASPTCRECVRAATVNVKHGTTNTYRKHGCRCDECKAAMNAAARLYRARRRDRGDPYIRKDYTPSPRHPCDSCGEWTRSKAAPPMCRDCAYADRRRTVISRTDRVAIFDRDEWTCGWCAGPVDRTLNGSHAMGPTLDHILPRSLGGSDDMENLRLLHRRCNVARSNSLDLTAS